MKEYKLLGFETIRRPKGGIFFWLGLVLLIAGIVDQIRPILDRFSLFVWGGAVLFGIVWLFYRLRSPRAFIRIEPDYLLVQLPDHELNLDYGLMDTIVASRLSQHYPRQTLRGRERRAMAPYYDRTCIFIELHHYPPEIEAIKKQYPRFLWGISKPGLLLIVDDWMTINREIDNARVTWRNKHKATHQEDRRTFVARMWDDYADEDESELE